MLIEQNHDDKGIIWPALYERSTGFERLKHVTGWAGQYEVSPDECAVLGSVSNGGEYGEQIRQPDEIGKAETLPRGQL